MTERPTVPRPAPITPDIDAYGHRNRAEALADWLELAAIADRPINSAQLGDLISDNSWSRKQPRQFRVPEGLESEMTPENHVDAVKKVLDRRNETLDHLWPFEIQDSWQVVKREGASLDVPYVALLCLTVAHAWGLSTKVDPEVILESTVVRALRAMGIVAAQVGTAVDERGDFENAVEGAAKHLGLPSNVNAVTHSLRAKDEGVDTLALVGWPSDRRRAGQWVFVGQATVGQSQTWERKIREPDTDHWAQRLLQPFEPQVFLAVPHQVSAEHLTRLVSNKTGLVIDRLRFALSLSDVSSDEKDVIDVVLSAGVYDGRAAA
ncbi:hypothetical protein [Demequina sp. NBRC 110054]|uniref:hypothetical protein n=1 Tax=Demequina sp. NBRC 110054 TaxID=1570343 RepID=UPI001177DBD5|nr:hypothetical protein [Demequina sp. NBRC 110054]